MKSSSLIAVSPQSDISETEKVRVITRNVLRDLGLITLPGPAEYTATLENEGEGEDIRGIVLGVLRELGFVIKT